MQSNATFLNAVMDVRVEQGVFHFVLGEMAPGQSGKVEFIPAIRCVLPAGEAPRFFAYLLQKAQAGLPTNVSTSPTEPTVQANGIVITDAAKQMVTVENSENKSSKRRRIATSIDGIHLK